MRALLFVCLVVASLLAAPRAHAAGSASPTISIAVDKATWEADYEGSKDGRASLAITIDSGCTDSKAVMYRLLLNEGSGTVSLGVAELYEGPNLRRTEIHEADPGTKYSGELEVWCCPLEALNCRSYDGPHGLARTPTSVVFAPYLGPVSIWEPPSIDRPGDIGSRYCLPRGREVTVRLFVEVGPSDLPEDGESAELIIRGAGIDFRRRLDSSTTYEFPLRADQAGTVEAYIVFEPHGLESVRRSIPVLDGECEADIYGNPLPGAPTDPWPGDNAPGAGDGSPDAGDKASGCSSARGALPSLPLLALVGAALLVGGRGRAAARVRRG